MHNLWTESCGEPVDLARSTALFARAAARGIAGAQYITGKEAERRGDFRTAFEHYSRAAKQNHVKAAWATAKMLWFGRGIPIARAEAVNLYEFLARKGHPRGMARYGSILHDTCPKQADDFFRRSAAQGYRDALYETALLDMEADPAPAFQSFKLAARKKHLMGPYYYALWTYQGKSCPADQPKDGQSG
jgi:TPR repeat protein